MTARAMRGLFLFAWRKPGPNLSTPFCAPAVIQGIVFPFTHPFPSQSLAPSRDLLDRKKKYSRRTEEVGGGMGLNEVTNKS